MKVLDIYDVETLNFEDKDSLIEYKSSGVVESTKYFPVYGNKIFKPLSKTKPLTTPLFAYSEVFWSYYIQKYFEEKAPRYSLATCLNIDSFIEKNYSIGTLVPIVTKNNQKLVNLLEYFRDYPDSKVSIDNYVNYCLQIYDYTNILNASIFEERVDLRNQLENQILLSILKQDENFHYENVSFIVEEDKFIELCPTLDSEFSLLFLYPDNGEQKKILKNKRKNQLSIPFEKTRESRIADYLFEKENGLLSIQIQNIVEIIKKDIYVVEEFIKKLDLFIEDIESTDILFLNKKFFQELNSEFWQIGHARYKENDEEKAKILESIIKLKSLNEQKFNKNLKDDCLIGSKNLKFILKVLLDLYYSNITEITIKKYLEIHDIGMNKEQFELLNIDEKLDLTENKKILKKK